METPLNLFKRNPASIVLSLPIDLANGLEIWKHVYGEI